MPLAALGEPNAHCFRQAFWMDAKTRFENTFGDRKCVIELGLAGEVAHTKIVEPIEGTGTAVSADNDVDAQPLSEHKVSIAARHSDGLRCSKFLAAAESAN